MMRACMLILIGSGLLSGQVAATPTQFNQDLGKLAISITDEATNYQADIAKGEQLANTRCVACHGEAMLKMMPAYPNLQGQKAAYLFKQLLDFKQGRRQNPLMQGQAAMLSELEMKDVAYYYSTLTP
ncbi:c-type cytochrome [Shewanella waksmanii]|uniref:c-type cytochrome n=1 Tax=Shewanella waksmanii TaxID=213783 RepID=UPI0004B0DF78|nr:cytochrome c [Shewanella waksmanii]